MPRKTTKPKNIDEITEATNSEQIADDNKSENAIENAIDPVEERIKFLASLGEILIEYFPEIKTADDLREMLECDDEAYTCDDYHEPDIASDFNADDFEDNAMLIPIQLPHISKETPVIMKNKNGETRVITNVDEFLQAFIENIDAAARIAASDKKSDKKQKKDKKKKHKNKKK